MLVSLSDSLTQLLILLGLKIRFSFITEKAISIMDQWPFSNSPNRTFPILRYPVYLPTSGLCKYSGAGSNSISHSLVLSLENSALSS